MGSMTERVFADADGTPRVRCIKLARRAPLDLDLHTYLNHMVRRHTEVASGTGRVYVHEGEDVFSPEHHSRSVGCEDRFPANETGGDRRLESESLDNYLAQHTLNVWLLGRPEMKHHLSEPLA